MKFLDPFDPIFNRAWVRLLCTIPPLVWGGFEFWMGEPFWGLIFIALGAYASWQLFVVRPRGK